MRYGDLTYDQIGVTLTSCARDTSTGVIGDPTHASVERGAKLWEAVVEAVACIFRSVGEDDTTCGA